MGLAGLHWALEKPLRRGCGHAGCVFMGHNGYLKDSLRQAMIIKDWYVFSQK